MVVWKDAVADTGWKKDHKTLIDKQKFFNANNMRRLKGIFYEVSEAPETAVYTLKDHEWKGFPSLYQLYLEASDPEEYTFATVNLADYEHWEQLCKASWFKPYLVRFRDHLDRKIKSQALARILKDAGDEESKTRFSSNRFLVEKGWASTKASRPSKDSIKTAAAEADKQILEDHSRMILKHKKGI